jgi:hypothetical protein
MVYQRRRAAQRAEAMGELLAQLANRGRDDRPAPLTSASPAPPAPPVPIRRHAARHAGGPPDSRNGTRSDRQYTLTCPSGR